MATILYESRLGCLGNSIPQLTADYIEALALMFCTFKTSMYAGAIPKWLRLLIPKPWQEFCRSWDGLFKFSKRRVGAPAVELGGPDLPAACVSHTHTDSGITAGDARVKLCAVWTQELSAWFSEGAKSTWVVTTSNVIDFSFLNSFNFNRHAWDRCK